MKLKSGSFYKDLLKRKNIKWAVLLILFFLFWFSLPKPLFEEPNSTVLLDKNGELLGAKIATDGQWRFPEKGNVPDKFQHAIIEFEDHSIPLYSNPLLPVG